VVNRFIDYWLHILLGALTWTMRKHIGLRTWKDVPPERVNNEYTVKTLVEKEDVP